MDDAGSIDFKKQDLKVAQSAKDDSATGPLQHHQFEIPVDCKDDVEMFSMPASPRDWDAMHKVRGVRNGTLSDSKIGRYWNFGFEHVQKISEKF